ncbi:MAG: hypothetical protein JWM02_3668 [Frankiales bacterium]|nr:hypothetical protein [Frankiales bacterium]
MIEGHCKRSSCRCTHTDGCSYGWLEQKDGAIHCPVCRPGRQQQPYETREQWMNRLREQDAAYQRETQRSA